MVYYEEPCFDYLDSVIAYIKYLIFEIKNKVQSVTWPNHSIMLNIYKSKCPLGFLV